MWLYRFNHALGPIIGAYWRLGLDGEVETIPREGPLILAANHSSYLDPWLIGMVFPRPIRYLIADNWYRRSAVWMGVFRAFGTLPVRDGRSRATIATACRTLDEGQVLGIFPEGRISPDGRIQPLHSGVARIAARSGVPVMPAGIRGGFESLPRSRRIPRPVRVSVHIARPVVYPDSPRESIPPRSEIAQFNDLLYRKIGRLAGRA